MRKHPDARITKMQGGRPNLAHTTEHAVELDTGTSIAAGVSCRLRYGMFCRRFSSLMWCARMLPIWQRCAVRYR